MSLSLRNRGKRTIPLLMPAARPSLRGGPRRGSKQIHQEVDEHPQPGRHALLTLEHDGNIVSARFVIDENLNQRPRLNPRLGIVLGNLGNAQPGSSRRRDRFAAIERHEAAHVVRLDRSPAREPPLPNTPVTWTSIAQAIMVREIAGLS